MCVFVDVALGGIVAGSYLQEKAVAKRVYTGLGHQIKATLWPDSVVGEEHTPLNSGHGLFAIGNSRMLCVHGCINFLPNIACDNDVDKKKTASSP